MDDLDVNMAILCIFLNTTLRATVHLGYVEGLYPTLHIHEQMTAYIMATSTATLSTTR